MVSIGIMNKQINVRLPKNLLISANKFVKDNGFSSLQELIKESVREKVFRKSLISKEEENIIKKIIELSENKKLYSTEGKLLKELRRKDEI